jgi:hypothetical protein
MNYFDAKTKVYTSFDQSVAETTLAKVLDRIAHPKDETRTLIDHIRNEADYDKRKALKQKLVGFTPSVVCGDHRKKDAILNYTGFAHIDLDAKDNIGISVIEMKQRLIQLDYVAFISLSASGNGIFALARIQPEKWDDSIETIITHLERIGLVADKSVLRNPVSLRFITYDTDSYINESAITLTPNPQKTNHTNAIQSKRDSLVDFSSVKKVERALLEIECENIDLTNGYENWLRIGFAMADEFGENGRGYFHTVSRNHPKYKPSETDRQYDHCLRTFAGQKITIGCFFHLCKEYGVGLGTTNRQSATIPKRDYSKYEKYLAMSDTDQSPKETPLPFDDETPIPITIPETHKESYLKEADGVTVLAQWLYEIDSKQSTISEPVFYPFEHPIYANIRPKHPQRFDESGLIPKRQKELRKKGLYATDLRYFDFETLLKAFGLKDTLIHVEHQTKIYQYEKYVLYPSYLEFVNGLTQQNP